MTGINKINKFSQISLSAFRYGSKVFSQANDISRNSLTDYILINSDSNLFHDKNIQHHGSDYSYLFKNILGSKGITKFQRLGKCKVFFNTNIKNEKLGMLKYGVIDKQDLLEDLLTWNSLYIAGRMHKPIDWVLMNYPSYIYFDEFPEMSKTNQILNQNGIQNDSSNLINEKNKTWNNMLDLEILEANEINRKRALLFAIFFSMENGKSKIHSLYWDKIYHNISNLSYNGDVRMVYKMENKNKVSNIVHGQVDQFNEIYRDNILSSLFSNVEYDEHKLYIHRNQWFEGLRKVGLPSGVVERVYDQNSYLGYLMSSAMKESQSAHQDLNQDADQELVNIPKNIDSSFFDDSYKLRSSNSNIKATFWDLIQDPDIKNFNEIQEIVNKALQSIVFKSSMSQLWKGFLTAGPIHSAEYAFKKMKKSITSRQDTRRDTTI